MFRFLYSPLFLFIPFFFLPSFLIAFFPALSADLSAEASAKEEAFLSAVSSRHSLGDGGSFGEGGGVGGLA
jgi:hypothetical protein